MRGSDAGGPHWPFLGAEALAAGALTERALRRRYVAVYPGVWIPKGLGKQKFTARHRAVAAWLWSRRRGIAVGSSAAALHRAKWLDPSLPAELVHSNHSCPPLLRVYRDRLSPPEIVTVAGISATAPARTAFDIGRRTESRLLAVQRLDALARVTGVDAARVEAVIAEHPGARSLARLRRVLPLVDGGAESPQETRTRLVLIDFGLPAPETQIVVLDDGGRFIGRVDMGYRELRVGVEYDGPQHFVDPEQFERDINRLHDLAEAGWHIIRVSSTLLRDHPGTIAARTERAMRAAGWLPRRVVI